MLRAAGGEPGEADAGEAWARERYRGPYLRDALLDAGAIVETLETATFWSTLHGLYAAVSTALRESLTEQGTPPVILCHISHVYPAGASLYYTIGCAALEDPVAQWRAAKAAAGDAILAAGGSITHHHGIGRDHVPWYEREIGELGIAALRAVKAQLDPAGILNPGILIPSSPDASRATPMNDSDRIRRLAELIVKFAANVQPGQIVSISSEPGKEPLARAVAEVAYEHGAKFVDLSVFDLHLKRARALHADPDTLAFVPPWYGQRMLALGEHRAAMIALTGPVEPHLMDGDRSRAARQGHAPAGARVKRGAVGAHDQLDGGPVSDRRLGRSSSTPRSSRRRRSSDCGPTWPASAGLTSPTRSPPGTSGSITCSASPQS